MTIAQGILVVGGLLSGLVLIGALLWSIVRPSKRIWPPNREHSVIPNIAWGLTLAVFGAVIGLGILDFNLVLRIPPCDAEGPSLGWHMEILPRIDGDAGFELASNTKIVHILPEDAAQELRDAPG